MRPCGLALLWAVAMLAAVPLPLAAHPPFAPGATVRQDLIGSWRLVSVDVTGPNGTVADPFYNTIASGLLIYDPSGWVSVQIASAPRPQLDAPASRRHAPGDSRTAKLHAEVLDSYYAYFGSWEYDAQTSTVTHHVKTSLYPGEQGASYSQQVQVVGRRMVFTRTQESTAGSRVQSKVWEKLGP